jgi:hypothetical protein
MAGGMFGELFLLPHFSTSHACSCCSSLVRSLVLWPIRCHSIGISYGIPRFSSRGSYFSDYSVVNTTLQTCHPRLINSQVLRQPYPPLPAFSLNAGRYSSRMGLRVWRSYQRILPTLSYPLCCTTFPRPCYSEDELGMFMGWKYILPGRVSFSRFHAPLSALLISVPDSRSTSMVSI